MLYLVCFIISLSVFVVVNSYSRTFDHYIILLVIIATISNGGYYAISAASSLEEALLGNKIAYLAAIYAPMVIFMIICNVCRVELKALLRLAMFTLQTFLYIAVCTIGKHQIFYKKVRFGTVDGMGYLTKTYGPLHSLYLVTMVCYVLAGIIVGLVSLNRRNVVSKSNVEVLLFSEAVVIAVYIVERFVNMRYELLPVALVVCMSIMLVPLVKIYRYSLYNNRSIQDSDEQKTGYIVFDRKLRYMGSNEYATKLFPELSAWELEKRIPGNGGRFNTFLRQPLMAFVNESEEGESMTQTFEHQGETFNCEISRLLTDNRAVKGYYVRISDITKLVGAGK